MSNKIAVFINGEAVLEYDRDVTLTALQRESLDMMDNKMDSGIGLAGQSINSPDQNQRIQFVALNLVHALANNNGSDALIAASSSYLAEKLADLKQVRADNSNGQWVVDLVFDKEYQNQVKVSFSGLQ